MVRPATGCPSGARSVAKSVRPAVSPVTFLKSLTTNLLLTVWDQDAWQQGVTALSDPAAGLSLARFRVRTHGAARKEAAQFGFAGAMYPWQSSGLDGFEALFADAWSGGQTETHITADVAVGLWESARLSGDDDFGRTEAWPVIADVARWIMSRGEVTGRGFETGSNR